jgi:hypothetical protein
MVGVELSQIDLESRLIGSGIQGLALQTLLSRPLSFAFVYFFEWTL